MSQPTKEQNLIHIIALKDNKIFDLQRKIKKMQKEIDRLEEK